MNFRIDPAIAVLAAVLVSALPGVSPASAASGAGFVAGLAPQQRPEAAPVVTRVNHDDAWRARALTGISAPLPASLRFLDNQGAWYTPFNHPGAPGYYDLRQWFGANGRSADKPGR